MADNIDLTPEQQELRDKALKLQQQAVGAVSEVKTDEQIAAEKEAADKAAQDQEAAKLAEAKAAEEQKLAAEKEAADKAADGAPKNLSELTDAQLLEIISKRTGATIASLDDLKPKTTDEDRKKEQEQRDANRVAYGLQKGHYNNADFQAYIHDLKNPADLVFEQYKAEAIAEDSELDEEEVAAEFAAKYGLDAEPDTRKWKRGQKELSVLAEGLIKQRHEKILKANAEFDTVEANSLSQKEYAANVNKALPQYAATVEKVFSSIGKRTLTIGDEKYDIEIDPKVIAGIKEKVSNADYAAQQIAGSYTEAGLQSMVETAALIEDFDNIVARAVEQALLRKQAGLRGIPAGAAHRQNNENEPELSEERKRAIQIMKERVPVPQSAN